MIFYFLPYHLGILTAEDALTPVAERKDEAPIVEKEDEAHVEQDESDDENGNYI